MCSTPKKSPTSSSLPQNTHKKKLVLTSESFRALWNTTLHTILKYGSAVPCYIYSTIFRYHDMTYNTCYTYSNLYPTRCNFTQFIYIWKLIYMFQLVPPPIIRSAYNCIYIIWYLLHCYCYLPLSW